MKLLTIAFALLAAPAFSATLQLDAYNRLTGAKDVDVGGTLYDMRFAPGSCTEIFTGCDEDSDFTFNSIADVTLAGQAILDQVLLDGPLGNFDSYSKLVAGTNLSVPQRPVEFLFMRLAYGVNADKVSFVIAANEDNSLDGTIIGNDAVFPDEATFAFVDSEGTEDGETIYVQWRLAGTPFPASTPAIVPLPASGLLLLIGVSSLISRRWR